MVTQQKEQEMVGPNKHGESPFRDALNRLDAIVSCGTAGVRLAHLVKREENLRGQGQRLSPDDCLNLGLALYDAGRMSLDEAVFWVCWSALGANNRAEQRIQTTYEEDFASRFEALAKRHGLNDEQWTPGDGPPEYEALNAEFEQAAERINAEVLREYANETGHPVLVATADLYESDPAAFERQVGRGRQQFLGSGNQDGGT
jgi:hypothetical protein